MSATPVQPPLLSPQSHNLLWSANIVTSDKESVVAASENWTRGVSFNPTGCYEVSGDCISCPPEDAAAANNCVDPVTFTPYTIQFVIEVPASSRDDDKQLKDLIELGTSSRLEDILWNGCENPLTAPGYAPSNVVSLSDAATTVDPVMADPTYGEMLGALVAELISAEGHIGTRGTIHLSPALAIPLDVHFEEYDGGLFTKVGRHQVIVGNYPPTAIIGHVGQVDVYLSDPEVKDAANSVSAGNRVYKQIERVAVVAWNSCATFAVETNVGS